MAASLLALVEDWARRDGGREAVVAGADRLTYAALAARVAGAAEGLRRAGFRPGGCVAFLGAPGAAFLISQLATHAAGGVWLGLNPRYSAPELRHVLADACAALIVAESQYDLAALETARAALDPPPPLHPVQTLDDLAQPPRLPRQGMAALDRAVALLVYTSGTTGAPKGAMLTHSACVAAAQLYASRYGHENFRTLLNLPINHVGALIDLVSPALVCGGAIVTMPSFDPGGIPDILRAERISCLGQVPAMHLAIDAAGGYDPASLPHLRHLVWSGAPMPRGWIEDRIDGRVKLSTCYGQTECTGSVTFTRPGASVEELADTVGSPVCPAELRIWRHDGAQAEPGETGEIQLSGRLLMAGYLNRPDATAEAMTADGWLRTGDLGLLDDAGRLRLVGRLKEMFKSGGYNVYPREVETALESHPAVAAAAVVAVPDDRWQEVGWAFVIAKANVSPDALAAHARQSLANYKLPKRILVRTELPMLPIGKIDKHALKAEIARGLHG